MFTFTAFPVPSPTYRLSGVDQRDRFSLTVAGPRRFYTGLPCYALTGTRGTFSVSAEYLL
ncbi:protein of unknown function [Nitrospira defluvii]|uniref:Uncharacterized protein n=1 Tax=Nitrospira defluvii TaxID=330214 RepID=D8PF01_9BACT|nr:protein of unknown function [Nitrospira defluvii]